MSDRLRAGRLSMVLQRDTGMLRDIRWDDCEILRGIYPAVRDQDWNTIPPTFDAIAVQRTPDGCTVSLSAECLTASIHYRWTGHIEARRSGAIVYRFQGCALRPFLRNRIGFCLLHADSCAGLPMNVQHSDGRWQAHHFPRRISPHQPVCDVRQILHHPRGGLLVQVRLDGDVFEMEDQRNWTDASFKTYCTPLSLAFPVRIEAEDRVDQTVTVQVNDANPPPSSVYVSVPTGPTRISGSADDVAVRTLPSIGLVLPAAAGAMPPPEVAALRDLGPEHLRVDLSAADPQLAARWQAAADAAKQLDSGLEVAARLAGDEADRLQVLLSCESADRQRVRRCFLFDVDGHAPAPQALAAAAPLIRRIFPAAQFGSGTDHYFAELNRRRPSGETIEVAAYSINPQVHAFDDASLMETLAVQPETVCSATAFLPDVAIAVTPITLLPRHNPNATAAGSAAAAPAADPRQSRAFTAAWTLGSLARLAESPVSSLTYFETNGPRGVMCDGVLYPVYEVLRDVLAWRGSEVVPVSVGDRRAAALRLRRDAAERWMIANLTDQPLAIQLDTDVRLCRLRLGSIGQPLSRHLLMLLPPYGVLVADQ